MSSGFLHACQAICTYMCFTKFFCFLLRARTPRTLMNTSTLMERSIDVLYPPL